MEGRGINGGRAQRLCPRPRQQDEFDRSETPLSLPEGINVGRGCDATDVNADVCHDRTRARDREAFS